jgi:uncharacterized YccA/Bax inhibitor family protein
MRTANPALSADTFLSEADMAPRTSAVMTVGGAVTKSAILTGLLVIAGATSWTLIHPEYGAEKTDPMFRIAFGIVAPLAGFVLGLITSFFPKVSPFTSPVYAILQGLFLGAISSFFSARYAGIAVQAALLTATVLAAMLVLYSTRVLRATPMFTKGVIAATFALCFVYLGAFLLSFAGINLGIFGNGAIGIVFSVIVVGIAALNLILDFDTIETGARAQAPKYMEWYAAFGLLVTLIWLYLEILRLLAKLRSQE